MTTIILTTFQRRDLFERLLKHWHRFIGGKNRKMGVLDTQLSEYGFAYWLVRYSGWTLTEPANPPEAPDVDPLDLERPIGPDVVEEVMNHVASLTMADIEHFSVEKDPANESELEIVIRVTYLTGIAVGVGTTVRDLIERCRRAKEEQMTSDAKPNYDNEGGTGTLDPSDR